MLIGYWNMNICEIKEYMDCNEWIIVMCKNPVDHQIQSQEYVLGKKYPKKFLPSKESERTQSQNVFWSAEIDTLKHCKHKFYIMNLQGHITVIHNPQFVTVFIFPLCSLRFLYFLGIYGMNTSSNWKDISPIAKLR